MPVDAFSAALFGMGAKYLPTIKDHKASQRFRRKQNLLPLAKKTSTDPVAKKRGKKE